MSLFTTSMLSLLFVLQPRPSACLLSVRYFAPSGVGISDISKYNHFKVHIQTHRYTHVLEAFNHNYKTQVPLMGDPCVWTLANGRKMVGRLDMCEGMIEYSLDGRRYRVGHRGDYRTMGTSEDESARSVSIEAISGDKNNNDGPPGTRPYRVNIFIFNDAERAGMLGKDVNKDTRELARMVDTIYLEGGMGIKINLVGILNMKNSIIRSTGDHRNSVEMAARQRSSTNILAAFKKLIEPIRYNPHNLATPLSKSDLSLLITSNPIHSDPAELYQHHGMTYFAGANGLNRSYSVVYAGTGDSKYFLAKKMAHEIAHSLGVHHDESGGYIMEASTCVSCDDVPRRFSSQSKAQMDRFLGEYRDVFQAQSSTDEENAGKVIMSKGEARAYIKKRRRHGFMDIVNKRLGGKIPETSYFTYYLGLSLIFYLVSICMAIYYLK